MSTLPILISPIQIVVFFSFIIVLHVAALFLASNSLKGERFFMWLFIIVMIPILGPVLYFIVHLANMNENKSTIS